jgi:hypothetical protein
MMSNIEYRNLEYDDVPALNGLIDNSESYLGFEASDTLMKELKQSTIKSLLDPNTQMFGVFENDTLIFMISAIFPMHYKTWILHGMYSLTNTDGLTSFRKVGTHFEKITNMLTEYGESNGYYSFLTRRTVKHQLAHERLIKRFNEKHSLNLRYELNWEQVLTKDTKPEDIKYAFWKMLDTPIDTVIVRYTLKDEYRKEL